MATKVCTEWKVDRDNAAAPPDPSSINIMVEDSAKLSKRFNGQA